MIVWALTLLEELAVAIEAGEGVAVGLRIVAKHYFNYKKKQFIDETKSFVKSKLEESFASMTNKIIEAGTTREQVRKTFSQIFPGVKFMEKDDFKDLHESLKGGDLVTVWDCFKQLKSVQILPIKTVTMHPFDAFDADTNIKDFDDLVQVLTQVTRRNKFNRKYKSHGDIINKFPDSESQNRLSKLMGKSSLLGVIAFPACMVCPSYRTSLSDIRQRVWYFRAFDDSSAFREDEKLLCPDYEADSTCVIQSGSLKGTFDRIVSKYQEKNYLISTTPKSEIIDKWFSKDTLIKMNYGRNAIEKTDYDPRFYNISDKIEYVSDVNIVSFIQMIRLLLQVDLS